MRIYEQDGLNVFTFTHGVQSPSNIGCLLGKYIRVKYFGGSNTPTSHTLTSRKRFHLCLRETGDDVNHQSKCTLN